MLVLSVSLSVIAEALTLLEDSGTDVWDCPGCECDRWCRTAMVGGAMVHSLSRVGIQM